MHLIKLLKHSWNLLSPRALLYITLSYEKLPRDAWIVILIIFWLKLPNGFSSSVRKKYDEPTNSQRNATESNFGMFLANMEMVVRGQIIRSQFNSFIIWSMLMWSIYENLCAMCFMIFNRICNMMLNKWFTCYSDEA